MVVCNWVVILSVCITVLCVFDPTGRTFVKLRATKRRQRNLRTYNLRSVGRAGGRASPAGFADRGQRPAPRLPPGVSTCVSPGRRPKAYLRFLVGKVGTAVIPASCSAVRFNRVINTVLTGGSCSVNGSHCHHLQRYQHESNGGKRSDGEPGIACINLQ